jgi:hypothetical protein
MHLTTGTEIDPMTETLFDNSDRRLFNAVLERVCRDLDVTDETRRLKLQDNILVLAKAGVRDFERLRDYAARPRIARFSMVDPA